MYILDVVPLVKIPKNTSQILSYFSTVSLEAGTVVSVPLGRAKVNALVLSFSDLTEDKLSLKNSSFKIKSIDKIISKEPVLSALQLELFKWFLKFYHSPIGLSAKLFLPSYLNKKKTPLKKSLLDELSSNSFDLSLIDNSSKKKNLLIFKKDRFKDYEKEINKTLKNGKQVLFLVPDLHLLDYWENKFRDLKPVAVSGFLSPKKYFDIWLSLKNGKNSFVISTRSGVFLNFKNLGLIILDEEEDWSYKSKDIIPYYNAKDIALKLSKIWGVKVIYGTSTPSISTYFSVKKGYLDIICEKEEIKRPQIIDMRNEMHGGNYSILSYDVEQSLKKVLEKKEKAIFFISRKGSETFVFCRDCGHVEKCPNCESSLIHKKALQSFLVCGLCNFKKDIPISCPSCGGLKIKYFGAGTQKAKDDIFKIFPQAKIEILDSDITPTYKEQKNILKKYKEGKIDILIGTQLLFKKTELLKSAELVCILSVDNILNIPEYKSPEKVFYILQKNRDFCKNKSNFFLQTYLLDNIILNNIIKDDYDSFYKKEIKERKIFLYPPFSNIIKLIYKNKNNKIAEIESLKLKNKLDSLKFGKVEIIGPLPSHITKIKNQYIWQILIKVNDFKNIKDKKNTLLKIVPEGWIIDVGPESLL